MSGDKNNPLGSFPKAKSLLTATQSIGWAKAKSAPKSSTSQPSMPRAAACCPALSTVTRTLCRRSGRRVCHACAGCHLCRNHAGWRGHSQHHESRDTHADQLVQQATAVLDAMLARGVTTVEGKSGYGLSTVSELNVCKYTSGSMTPMPWTCAPPRRPRLP